MAKDKKAKKSKKSGGGMGTLTLMAMFFGSVGLAIVVKMAFIFLLGGLLPSIVAGIVDQTYKRRGFKIVTSLNVSGILPYMSDLWRAGNSVDAVYQLASDPLTWVVIYGAAAAGWALVWLGPKAGLVLVEVYARGQVSRLQHTQRRLIEEWGPEIRRDASR